MHQDKVESTGSLRRDQESKSLRSEFFNRRARLYEAWRTSLRATNARMVARYPGLYSADLERPSACLPGAREALPALTKNVNRRVRKSDARDRNSIAIIKACEVRAAEASEDSFSRQSTPPSTHPFSRSSKPVSRPFSPPNTPSSKPTPHTLSPSTDHSPSTSLDAGNDDASPFEGVTLPSWQYAGDRLKLTCVARAVSASSGGLAFSLNLSPANENKAKALGADWLRKRVVNHLEAVLGVRGVVLVLEATGGRKDHGKGSTGVAGRLHAHGIVEATSNEIEAVRGALKAAGGRWADPRGMEHQVDARPLTGADGWVRYILEDQARTRRVVGHDRLISTSRSLIEPGRAVLEELREKYSKKKSTKEDVAITKFSGVKEFDLDESPSEVHEETGDKESKSKFTYLTADSFLSYSSLVKTKSRGYPMNIETISIEDYAYIRPALVDLEEKDLGLVNVVTGWHPTSGFVLFLVGPMSEVVMASERGSLPAYVSLGLVAAT